MTVQGNGGNLAFTHKATCLGYKQYLRFRKYYITNIMALKKLIKKDQVTYSIIDKIFLVYREDQEKPNMELSMIKSGIHCYNPTDKKVVLINTVSVNEQVFSKGQINGAEQAKHCTSNLVTHKLHILVGFLKYNNTYTESISEAHLY